MHILVLVLEASLLHIALSQAHSQLFTFQRATLKCWELRLPYMVILKISPYMCVFAVCVCGSYEPSILSCTVQWNHVWTGGVKGVIIVQSRNSELHCSVSLIVSLSTQDEYEAILGCIEDALDLPNQPSEWVHASCGKPLHTVHSVEFINQLCGGVHRVQGQRVALCDVMECVVHVQGMGTMVH